MNLNGPVSKVHMRYCMDPYLANVRAALVPQGSFRGLSKVFPNRISSAECGCRNLPGNLRDNQTLRA
jgi:hypothetical protein